jgi:hypothetical protein
LGSNRTRELFIRWSQMGAFCPLMENGGNGEHRPWYSLPYLCQPPYHVLTTLVLFLVRGYDTPSDTSTTDIYRKMVAAHMQLIPYLMTTGTQAFEQNKSSIEPFARPPISFAKSVAINNKELHIEGPFEDDNAWPSTFDYMLGKITLLPTLVLHSRSSLYTIA